MPDGYCWVYPYLLAIDWYKVGDDMVQWQLDLEDIEALEALAWSNFPPAIEGSMGDEIE